MYGVKPRVPAKKPRTMMTAVPQLVGAPLFSFSVRGLWEWTSTPPFQPLEQLPWAPLAFAGGAGKEQLRTANMVPTSTWRAANGTYVIVIFGRTYALLKLVQFRRTGRARSC